MKIVAGEFWSKIERSEYCWLWQGTRTRAGYGSFRKIHAHRVAWELTYGPIPQGLCVCHHCDNPPCVRPGHLFLGTQADNIRDAVRKGRMPGNPTPCTEKNKERFRTIYANRPGHPHTESTKALLSLRARQRTPRKLTQETKEKLKIAGKRRGMTHLHTPEVRAKSAASLRGTVHSPSRRMITSISLRGKSKSEAHRRHLALANATYAKEHPDIIRYSIERLRLLNTGKKHSPERIAKRRETMLATIQRKRAARADNCHSTS